MHFIPLVRIMVDLEPVEGTLSLKWEYSLDEMVVHYRTP